MTAAVITGAAGWLGRALVRAICHGIGETNIGASDRRLRLLAHTDQEAAELVSLTDNRAEIIVADVTVAESLEPLCADLEPGFTVFHCAGLIHPRRIRHLYAVNSQGTRTVIDVAVRGGARRFVHVSSNSPIGINPRPDHEFDEQAPYAPYMAYGASKKLAEDAVNEANRRGVIEGVIIRAPWFYGPGQPPRQSEFFSMIKHGKVPLVGDGSNRRSMAYIDNICLGMMLAETTQCAAGRTYWIADRRSYSMREIISTIADVLELDFGIEVKRSIRRLPGFTSTIAFALDKVIQSTGLYSMKLHVLSEMNKTIACSIARAADELGYDPPIALREGMRRSVEDLLARGATIA